MYSERGRSAGLESFGYIGKWGKGRGRKKVARKSDSGTLTDKSWGMHEK